METIRNKWLAYYNELQEVVGQWQGIVSVRFEKNKIGYKIGNRAMRITLYPEGVELRISKLSEENQISYNSEKEFFVENEDDKVIGLEILALSYLKGLKQVS